MKEEGKCKWGRRRKKRARSTFNTVRTASVTSGLGTQPALVCSSDPRLAHIQGRL